MDPLNLFEVNHGSDVHESVEIGSADSVELVENYADELSEPLEDQPMSGPVVPTQAWNEMVAHGFAQFRQIPESLLFP